jgi:hypothetical protein
MEVFNLATFWARSNVTGYKKETFFVITEGGQVFKWVTENEGNRGFKKLDVTPDQVELTCDEVNIGHTEVFAMSEGWMRFKKSSL